MNARQAHEMLQASLARPHLTTMVVPAPVTFEYDATISKILKERRLGDLVYIEAYSYESDPYKVPSLIHATLPKQIPSLRHFKALD